MSETYIDDLILCDDINLALPGYTLVLSDHPSNTIQGGVCIIKILSLKLICIHHLQESIKLKVRIEEKL